MLPVMRCKAGKFLRINFNPGPDWGCGGFRIAVRTTPRANPPLALFLLLRCFLFSFLGFFRHDELLGLWLGKQGRLCPCGTARGAVAKASVRL